MGDFSDKVFDVVRLIPAGKVSTYGQIARMIGSPRSARYVGYALRSKPSPAIGEQDDAIPCHRVVFKDGRLATGFAFGGEGVQRGLLEAEGITFDDEGRVRMDAHLWDGSISDPSNDDDVLSLGPPPGFDWESELRE